MLTYCMHVPMDALECDRSSAQHFCTAQQLLILFTNSCFPSPCHHTFHFFPSEAQDSSYLRATPDQPHSLQPGMTSSSHVGLIGGSNSRLPPPMLTVVQHRSGSHSPRVTSTEGRNSFCSWPLEHTEAIWDAEALPFAQL